MVSIIVLGTLDYWGYPSLKHSNWYSGIAIKFWFWPPFTGTLSFCICWFLRVKCIFSITHSNKNFSSSKTRQWNLISPHFVFCCGFVAVDSKLAATFVLLVNKSKNKVESTDVVSVDYVWLSTGRVGVGLVIKNHFCSYATIVKRVFLDFMPIFPSFYQIWLQNFKYH